MCLICFFLLTIAAVAVFAVYLSYLSFWIKGWKKSVAHKQREHAHFQFMSVVVAFRNEALNLPNLLVALASQHYPTHGFEVILVNDGSSDHWPQVVKSYPHANIRVLESGSAGKKAALRLGVQQALGNVVLVTDADCVPSPHWIASMMDAMLDGNADLVIGPVAMGPANSFFEKFQQIDFLSLQLSGAGAALNRKPIMCNGANMAFSKQFYLDAQLVGGKYLSGDDMFLLHCAKKEGKNVMFAQSSKAIVGTKPEPTLGSFFRQRVRWASKAKGYFDADTLKVAMAVAAINFALVGLVLFGFFDWRFFVVWAFGFVVKAIAEKRLFAVGETFFSIRHNLSFYLLVQMLHPFYTVGVVTVSLFANVRWKGRKVIR